jgi:K+-transporting ATPase ATPase C chain
MLQTLRPAVVMMALFTLVLGLAYPLAMTGAATALFAGPAGGTLLKDRSGRVVGSLLIAQGFTRAAYMHPRASAAGNGYDPTNSGGTQLGPLDPKLIARVQADAASLRLSAGQRPIPADALTTSASGLDPDISPANAHMQAPRIAAARGVSVSDVDALVDTQTRPALLGFVGQPHVNVLAINRMLDARFPLAHAQG